MDSTCTGIQTHKATPRLHPKIMKYGVLLFVLVAQEQIEQSTLEAYGVHVYVVSSRQGCLVSVLLEQVLVLSIQVYFEVQVQVGGERQLPCSPD